MISEKLFGWSIGWLIFNPTTTICRFEQHKLWPRTYPSYSTHLGFPPKPGPASFGKISPKMGGTSYPQCWIYVYIYTYILLYVYIYKDTKASLISTQVVGQKNDKWTKHGPIGCMKNRSTDPPRTTDNAGCGPIHPQTHQPRFVAKSEKSPLYEMRCFFVFFALTSTDITKSSLKDVASSFTKSGSQQNGKEAGFAVWCRHCSMWEG